MVNKCGKQRYTYGLNANNYSATSGREDVYNYFIGLMEAARNQAPPDIGIDSADIDMVIDGDVLVFTATLDYAGESLTIENLFTGQDTRSALNLFWYDNSNPNQQRISLYLVINV